MADAAEPSGAPASPFRSREQMIQQAGKIGLIELRFPKAPERSTIYAHTSYLIASSGVLRCLLQDQDEVPQRQAKKARTDSSANDAISGLEPIEAVQDIPLDDEKTSAWEAALSLHYPGTMLQAKVTWDNAADLLLLADKYDMPVVMDRVKSFLKRSVGGAAHKQTQLSAGLTVNNVFNLLKVFSRCRLNNFADRCIKFIAHKELQLPEGYLVCGLLPEHTEQLYRALRKQLDTKLSDNARVIQDLKSTLATTKYELNWQRHQTHLRKCGLATCSRCDEPWYWLLDDDKPKVSPVCMRCGVLKRTGYQE